MAKSKVKSRSNHDAVDLQLTTKLPQQISTSCNLQFLKYSPDNIIVNATDPPYALGEKNTHTAFKGCGLKTNLD